MSARSVPAEWMNLVTALASHITLADSSSVLALLRGDAQGWRNQDGRRYHCFE